MRLFEPGEIGNLLLKNRIIMAPMGVGGLIKTDGRFSQRAIDYYTARAKGGTGLIVTSLTRVSRKIERLPNLLFLHPMADDYAYVARLSELADAVHDYGTKIAVQFTAGYGRVAPPFFLKSIGAVGPSQLPCFWDSSVSTRGLATGEIEQLVKDFKLAARILKTAGIDAIQLHAHEGYLLDQFQTALWNRRADKYGRTLEGRLTFALEVIEPVKGGSGEGIPIIYRFGLQHCLKGGRELQEGLEIARRLERAGVDALEVDAGCYETWYWPHPTTYQPPGCMVEMAARVKEFVTIPVVAVGNLGGAPRARRERLEGRES